MKIYTRTIPVFLMAISVMVFQGCKGDGGEANEAEGSAESSEIVVSMEQFANAGMEIGNPEAGFFQQTVKVNGNVEASPRGMARLGSSVSGKLTSINYLLGERVKKGDVLFAIEGNEIILLQQEYAEACSRMVLLESNLERMKHLSKENIAAKKELVLAESEYKKMLSTKEGLKARLTLIGVDVKGVEAGRISSGALVRSPLSAYVSEINVVLGQYVQSGETLMEVVDRGQLQLNLHVFEKDIEGLEVGQLVHYFSPNKSDVSYDATLVQLGKRIDSESRTIQCVARLEDGDKELFMNGSFVEAEIVTCKREAVSLPSSAFLEENGRNYVFAKVEETGEGMVFKKVPVKTGVQQNDKIEILEEGLKDVLLDCYMISE